MGEGNRLAGVTLFTFTIRPGPHADTAWAVISQLAQLKLWLACSRELMSCVGRLPLFLQLSATNTNSTTHNGSQHRRGCLLPSPIIISLALVGAFFGHCEISRTPVDSSTVYSCTYKNVIQRCRARSGAGESNFVKTYHGCYDHCCCQVKTLESIQ